MLQNFPQQESKNETWHSQRAVINIEIRIKQTSRIWIKYTSRYADMKYILVTKKLWIKFEAIHAESFTYSLWFLKNLMWKLPLMFEEKKKSWRLSIQELKAQLHWSITLSSSVYQKKNCQSNFSTGISQKN